MRPLLLLVSLAVVGCDQPPVVWSDPVAVAQPAGETALVVDTAGGVRFVADSARTFASPAANACTASVRSAVATTHLFAGWWSVRRDSSAALYVAESADSGRTWAPPIPVDTSDRSTNGCARPAPALATVGDDVFVAYSMTAPEGIGVFAAHTMGGMLHTPVAAIYGDHLVAVAIAARGDRVAVAYEEPNGTRSRIDLALSATQGHIFEAHDVASRDVDVATAPEAALAGDGRTIAISWTLKRPSDGASERVVRVGHWP